MIVNCVLETDAAIGVTCVKRRLDVPLEDCRAELQEFAKGN